MRKTKILFVLVMLFYAFAAKAYVVEFDYGRQVTVYDLNSLSDDENDNSNGICGEVWPDFTVDGICYRIIDYYAGTVAVTFSHASLGHDTDAEEGSGYYITDHNNSLQGGTYSAFQIIPSKVMYSERNWSVVSIEYGAFWRSQIPDYLYIPSSVNTFENAAFRAVPKVPNLKVFFESATPPTNALVWGNSPREVTLYVQKGSLQAYQNWYYATWDVSFQEARFGLCGENAMWLTTDDETLEILGTGAMKNYSSAGPWSNITGITTVQISEGITVVGEFAFAGLSNLTNLSLPKSLTKILDAAFWNCSSLTSLSLPEEVTQIGQEAFLECVGLKELTFGSKMASLANRAFYGCTSIETVTCYAPTPPTGSLNTFGYLKDNSLAVYMGSVDLYVLESSVSLYANVMPWSRFKSVNAITVPVDITIGSDGIATFCYDRSLDFTDSDVKAYIVSAYVPSTGKVVMTRIYDVPAETGIVIKGEPGVHEVPYGIGETVVANMLVGVTEDTQLSKVDGDYTNYILAKKNDEVGFYAVTDGSTLGANKAYLPLPTAKLPVAAAARLMIEFDDETTGISEIDRSADVTGTIYNLSGQRMGQLRKGLNIVGGRKVLIK